MSFFVELWQFLSARKKFWLMPIVLLMLVFGALVVVQGTAVAPFMYTLF
jgi:hypothetical protein